MKSFKEQMTMMHAHGTNTRMFNNRAITEAWEEVETNMLKDIAKRLKSNPDVLTNDPLRWKLQKLDNLGLINTVSVNRMRNLSDIENEKLSQALAQSGLRSVQETDEELAKYLKEGTAYLIDPTPDLAKDAVMQNILLAYRKRAGRTLNLTGQTLIDQQKEMFIKGVNQVSMEVSLGETTPDVAIRRLVNEWGEGGIPAFIDKSGKKWGLEGYLNTVLRTQNAQIAREMQEERQKQWGVTLVEISKHPGDRPLCAPYAGRIFSLVENNEEYPDYTYLYDPNYGEIGHPASLFGINCGHFQYSYIPGVTHRRHHPSEDPEKDAQIYKDSQRQRQLERSIRNAKRRKQLMDEIGDDVGSARAQKLISARQKRMRDFIDGSGRTRYYGNEGIIGNHPDSVRPEWLDQKGIEEWARLGDENTDKMTGEEYSDIYKSFVRTSNAKHMNKYIYDGSYDRAMGDLVEHGTRYTDEVNNLTNLLDRYSIPKDVKLYRTASPNYIDNVLEDVLDIKIDDYPEFGMWNSNDPIGTGETKKWVDTLNTSLKGVEYKNETFMSTSYSREKNMFKRNDVWFEINTPKGTKGLITDNDLESEVLLQRGQTLKFNKFEVRGTKANGQKLFVDVDIVNK